MGKLREWWHLVKGKPMAEVPECPDPLWMIDVKDSTLTGGKLSKLLSSMQGQVNPAMNIGALGSGRIFSVSDGPSITTTTEAVLRIERAVNGKLVRVARNEGENYRTWLVTEGTDIMEIIKQALADLKV